MVIFSWLHQHAQLSEFPLSHQFLWWLSLLSDSFNRCPFSVAHMLFASTSNVTISQYRLLILLTHRSMISRLLVHLCFSRCAYILNSICCVSAVPLTQRIDRACIYTRGAILCYAMWVPFSDIFFLRLTGLPLVVMFQPGLAWLWPKPWPEYRKCMWWLAEDKTFSVCVLSRLPHFNIRIWTVIILITEKVIPTLLFHIVIWFLMITRFLISLNLIWFISHKRQWCWLAEN